ncbi:NUDIX domain-containing protein [Arenimonas sp.]|uniref:NUDIX domain-containing protein n=1 Tax=Arenimonas sp. TaxID=1872635 RepID=UPI0025E360F2|nr:NUDIX domain-containing protein [Arenimonas sp.]
MHPECNLPIRFGEFPEAWDSVLVVLFHEGRLVLGLNGTRGGWEFPGGHREGQEHWQETARREAWEEAGAIVGELTHVGYYEIPGRHTTLIAHAIASRLDELPAGFEMVDRGVFDELPGNLTFDDGLYEAILHRLRDA